MQDMHLVQCCWVGLPAWVGVRISVVSPLLGRLSFRVGHSYSVEVRRSCIDFVIASVP